MKQENPFKKIETNKDVPPEIKQTVMKNIALVRLLMDFGDLFSTKFSSVIESLFTTKNN